MLPNEAPYCYGLNQPLTPTVDRFWSSAIIWKFGPSGRGTGPFASIVLSLEERWEQIVYILTYVVIENNIFALGII